VTAKLGIIKWKIEIGKSKVEKTALVAAALERGGFS
jgi:hypothetical protein